MARFVIRKTWTVAPPEARPPSGGQSSPADGRLVLRPVDPVAEVLEEVDSLGGLVEVKRKFREIAYFATALKARRDAALAESPVSSFHAAFRGPPGTGKTTVARLYAKLLKATGILPTGNLVETDRSGLVGGYIGHTAIKTDERIREAIGGVLFIDEAYDLDRASTPNDFGTEAITKLVAAMENHRHEMAVVVAGYTREMEGFLSRNPGLRSRFKHYVDFQTYSSGELRDMVCRELTRFDFEIEAGAVPMIERHFATLLARNDPRFGNARAVRNFVERAAEAQMARLGRMIAGGSDGEARRALRPMTVADIAAACTAKE